MGITFKNEDDMYDFAKQFILLQTSAGKIPNFTTALKELKDAQDFLRNEVLFKEIVFSDQNNLKSSYIQNPTDDDRKKLSV